jgi:hypothetical protein
MPESEGSRQPSRDFDSRWQLLSYAPVTVGNVSHIHWRQGRVTVRLPVVACPWRWKSQEKTFVTPMCIHNLICTFVVTGHFPVPIRAYICT